MPMKATRHGPTKPCSYQCHIANLTQKALQWMNKKQTVVYEQTSRNMSQKLVRDKRDIIPTA